MVSTSAADNLELFTQSAFEQLQFLREYAGVLLDPYPAPEAIEQLFQSAQMLAETAAQSGLPLFSEIAGKLAHLFQYALNTTITPESSGPIVDFIYDAVALLESDLLQLSTNGAEADDDIQAFKEKYPFAFQAQAQEPTLELPSAAPQEATQESDQGSVQEVSSEAPVLEAAELSPAISIEPLPADGEVPAEILEFFVPEAEEHLQGVTECLLALEANPGSEVINRLFRAMHTVKGSAAQVGFDRIAHVAHRAEDLIGRVRDGELRPSGEIVDVCLEVVDALKKFLYRQWPDEATMQATVGSLLARIAQLAPAEPTPAQALDEPPDACGAAEVETAPESVPEAASEVEAVDAEPLGFFESGVEPITVIAPERAEKAAQAASTGAAPPKELSTASQSKSVRVPLERLDRMMNAVGELVINRTRMLGRLGELERLAEVLNFSKGRLIDKVGEFQERYEFTRLNSDAPGPGAPGIRSDLVAAPFSLTNHYRDIAQTEFSELEWDRYDDFNILSRSLTEISADLTEVLTQLGRFVRAVDSDIDEFTNLAHRLQDEITQARMVPIGNLYTRLSRTLRDAAKAAGKQVELILSGAETDLDNGIIQQISDPLIHLVRNSVAHGIESSQERAESGKPLQGQVAMRAYHRGNQIFIEVEDDGRGIDYEKIRATAQAQELVTPDEAARLTERELLEFLFRPGFSTAVRKTELAGRGVGLDVVRANLSALNGEISIETEKGVGTRFTLKVPLTLIITQALFLRHGAWTFGIPLACVEEIRRLRTSEIEEVGSKLLTRVRDRVTEVVRLDTRLGIEPIEPINGFHRMVTVNVSGRQVGIIVEEVLRKDEIVIKGLGEYLRNVKLFSGATIAPDGSPILLIDVCRLVAAESQEPRPALARTTSPDDASAPSAPAHVAAKKDSDPQEKTILLVDDSISVRRFVGRMLEKGGYKVRFASDGLEALETATQGGCDLVLTDLEMPRTNGYELMAHLRQHSTTRGLPVIVLTSRVGSKHREKALREGAAGFLTKPVQEEQLLTTVSKYLGGASPKGPLLPKTAGTHS
jgi:chemosensory pili system protein ChpA (sensor histidine kinase/response regulator)